MRRATIHIADAAQALLAAHKVTNTSGAINWIIQSYYEILDPIINDLNGKFTENEQRAIMEYMRNPFGATQNSIDMTQLIERVNALSPLEHSALMEMLETIRRSTTD